eukprot:5748053-Prymnesium_polylepis.1
MPEAPRREGEGQRFERRQGACLRGEGEPCGGRLGDEGGGAAVDLRREAVADHLLEEREEAHDVHRLAALLLRRVPRKLARHAGCRAGHPIS